MLEIQHISKSFNRKFALDDVSLRVQQGEVLGLLGPNGAGKTTLLRIINQIMKPDNGTITFLGEPLAPKHLSYIGYLPEERGLYRSMTVADHVIFLGRLRGMTKQAVRSQLNYWLQKFEIEDWGNKRIEELSKGMAQKVQFICSVIHQPQLLILDEPMSGFDPVNVELMKRELREMKSAGKTILVSTHDMKSVEEICDRAVLIHQSRKIAEGKIIDLQESRKKGLYAVKFKGNMIAFVNALWTGFELIDQEALDDNRFVVHVKMRGESTFQDLLKVILGQVTIEAAWEVLPSMQDIFIEMVQSKKELHDEK
jgi:ABC-2 type transport system ATP-binding protein